MGDYNSGALSKFDGVTVHGGRVSEYYEGKRGLPTTVPNTEYVYVNSGFVGSTSSVNQVQRPRIAEPPTSVVREQYWACSKWPYGQRVLAVAVGVLVGAVISLSLILVLGSINGDNVGVIFRSHTAPD